MIISKLQIVNFRSIKDTREFPVQRMLGFIGENNSGKSNIIAAIESLMSAGSGGIAKKDFNEPDGKIIIKGTFTDLSCLVGQNKVYTI